MGCLGWLSNPLCLSWRAVKYIVVLQVSTTIPLVISFMLATATLLMVFKGQTGTERFNNVSNNFW